MCNSRAESQSPYVCDSGVETSHCMRAILEQKASHHMYATLKSKQVIIYVCTILVQKQVGDLVDKLFHSCSNACFNVGLQSGSKSIEI